jgi:hypothetical protein
MAIEEAGVELDTNKGTEGTRKRSALEDWSTETSGGWTEEDGVGGSSGIISVSVFLWNSTFSSMFSSDFIMTSLVLVLSVGIDVLALMLRLAWKPVQVLV